MHKTIARVRWNDVSAALISGPKLTNPRDAKMTLTLKWKQLHGVKQSISLEETHNLFSCYFHMFLPVQVHGAPTGPT